LAIPPSRAAVGFETRVMVVAHIALTSTHQGVQSVDNSLLVLLLNVPAKHLCGVVVPAGQKFPTGQLKF
jgi:hypothetical protein